MGGMTDISIPLRVKRCADRAPSERTAVKSGMRRWTLRCRDLMSRDSYVITQVDRATGDLLLHVTGSKPMLLSIEDAERLRRQLAEAIDAATGTVRAN